MNINEPKLREAIQALITLEVCPDNVDVEKCDKTECLCCWLDHLKEKIW